jgi:hypothetical protein
VANWLAPQELLQQWALSAQADPDGLQQSPFVQSVSGLQQSLPCEQACWSFEQQLPLRISQPPQQLNVQP